MSHKLRLYPIKLPDRKPLMAEIGWDDDDIRPERRRFVIDTFAIFKRDPESWENLKPINEILASLDHDEAQYLVRLFVQAKRAIMGVTDRTSLINAIVAIDEVVAKTFKRLELSRRIYEFIINDPNIAEPDLTDVGKRVQDTPEKTFLKPEYDQLKTIIIITKLLFPIFGEIIDKVTNIDDSSNDTKEIMAFGIMNTLLRTDFNEITLKLQKYIDGLVSKSMTDDPMTSFRGLTQSSMTADRLAKMIVKAGVNFDLYKKGGNIIMLLVVSLKRSVQNDSSGTGKKVMYKAMFVPEKGEDGRNISIMEHESHVLKEPLEVPIIVELSVDHFIKNYLEQNNISTEVFERIVRYYKTTTLPPTIVNEWLIGLFIADPIGSAYCVKYMNIDMFSKLASIIQIYAIRMGFGSIAPILTMIPSGIRKTVADDVDNFIITGGLLPGVINYYIHLKEQTLHLDRFNNFRFDDYLANITSFIIEYNQTFNLAPDIAIFGNTGNSREEIGVFKYDKELINEVYRFAYHLLTQARPDRLITQ